MGSKESQIREVSQGKQMGEGSEGQQEGESADGSGQAGAGWDTSCRCFNKCCKCFEVIEAQHQGGG